MIKHFSDKFKGLNMISSLFPAEDFSNTHPSYSCNTKSYLNCHCKRNGECRCISGSTCKISRHNLYAYRKQIPGTGDHISLDRSVTDLDKDDQIVSVSFKVANWKCGPWKNTSPAQRKRNQTQKYHAFLPSAVPKYGRHTYRFILRVLKDYLERGSETVRHLCSRWMIAVSTLYRWISIFKAQIGELYRVSDTRSDELLNNSFSVQMINELHPGDCHNFYKVYEGITFLEQRAWMRKYGTTQ